MNLVYFAFVIATTIQSVYCGHCNSDSCVEEWMQAGRIVSQYAWPLKGLFCQLIDSIVQQNLGLNEQCIDALKLYSEQLAANHHEALVLFDSFSHIQAGFLTDRVHSFGHYDQCIKSSFKSKPSRYALIQVKWPLPPLSSRSMSNKITHREWKQLNHSWVIGFSKNVDHFEGLPQLVAICVPSQCSQGDLESILSSVSSQVKTLNFTLHSSQSMDEDPHQWYNGSLTQKLSRGILIIFATWIVIASTMCQLLPAKQLDWFVKSFDLVDNAKQVFDLAKDQVSPTNFISGYKGLYLLTSIYHHLSLPLETSIGHFFLPIHFLMQSDPIWNVSSRLFSCYSAVVSISAMLQAISWFKSPKPQPFVTYVLKRAFRTLPVTIVRMLFTFSLPLMYFSGPLVGELQNSLVTKCIKTYWTELLFIGNWFPFKDLCFSVSWFISADLQLYAVSFFILCAILRSEKQGYSLVAIYVVIGFTLEAMVLYKFDVKPAIAMISVPRITGVHDVFYYAHILSHNYIASYSIGLVFGYLIHKNVPIRPVTCIIGLITSAIPIVCVYWTHQQTFESNLPRPLEVLYSSILRVSASCFLGLGSLVLLRLQPSKFIRIVLANKLLLLLNRLSFSAYMVHPFLIFFIQSSRVETDYSFCHSLMQFTFITLASMILGFVVKISVEMPFDKIVRDHIFPQEKKTSDRVKSK